MAGKIDFKELKAMGRRIEALTAEEENRLYRACCHALAAKLLRLVIQRTPVKTGTLLRGWTAVGASANPEGTEKEISINAYAKSLPVTKRGNVYEVTIINPTEYASYVEYGHRTRNHRDVVKGRKMLTISENQLRAMAPAILEKEIEKQLRRVFKSD